MKYKNHIPKKNRNGSMAPSGQTYDCTRSMATRNERRISNLLAPIYHLSWNDPEKYQRERKRILTDDNAKKLGISRGDLEVLKLLTD
jgi:hypothetical protein